MRYRLHLLAALVCVACSSAIAQEVGATSAVALFNPVPVPKPIIDSCTAFSSSVYKVPQIAVKVVLHIEAGKIGTISRNDNNTFDLGPMQFNSSNLDELQKTYPYITWKHVTYDPCINIMVGTWWLSKKINGRKGNVWDGIGDYHSRTPVHHNRYLADARKAYTFLLSEEAKKVNNNPPAMISPSLINQTN